MFKLEGKKSFLVSFDEKHLNDPNYFGWLRDYEVIKTINRIDYIKPVSFDAVKEYCQNVMNSQTDIFLAVYDKNSDTFIGTARVSKIDLHARTADIGILIGDKKFWGKGIATDAIRAVCLYLFNIFGMRKLTSGVMAINPGMIKVFEKLGFQKEGVFRKQDRFEGAYYDHIYFGCFKEEFLG
ncbi:N-acetyltransferase GCN5 [Candidatus Omnitrophus magneticus]|uniref:N-acetyltransferase GCN5 n=1 Tax=Candidatus Omnitrophus magneticus TaxID=1609969 RepID=A0A0F0CNU2_9BACT|nr:N-acetyltransferase GCN5 [Candidatus Omnitrophus magneticus]